MGTGSHQGFGPGFATHAPAEGPGLEARHGWQECEPFPDFPALPDPEQGMGTPEGDQAGDKGHSSRRRAASLQSRALTSSDRS